jgi:hypothetical protein
MEDTTKPETPQPALNDLVPREVVERLGRTLAETAGTGNTAQLDSLHKLYEDLRAGSYATPQVFFSLNRHLQASHLGARGKAPPKRTRFPVGFVSLFPELSYLEEISHDGFLARDDRWTASHPDFHFCGTHLMVCEAFKCKPASQYDPVCGNCPIGVDNDPAAALEKAFFLPDQRLTFDEARKFWQAFEQKKPPGLETPVKELPKDYHTPTYKGPKLITFEEKNDFVFRERAAWLRYKLMAWQANRYRIAAIRAHAANPGSSAAYNMLPISAYEELVTFAEDMDRRHTLLTGNNYDKHHNTRRCEIHFNNVSGNWELGHAFHTFNKTRYNQCGICVLPREESQLQREADAHDQRTAPSLQATPAPAAAAAPPRTGKWHAPR